MEFPGPSDIKFKYLNKETGFKKLISRIRKLKPNKIDKIMHDEHEKVYYNYDCLFCANCCKTISPIINNADIERLSKKLKMSRSAFIDTYCIIDEDEDYVWNSTPCPFLMPDNYCMVYESRPRACREYPHTDRKNMRQILNLTLKNASVCPIVYKVLDELENKDKLTLT